MGRPLVITGPGKLWLPRRMARQGCFGAATTCFSHASGWRDLSKARADGTWYVFKNARVGQMTEFAKLRPAISGRELSRIDARLGRVE